MRRKFSDRYFGKLAGDVWQQAFLLGVLLVGYAGLHKLLWAVWVRPPDVYTAPSITVAALQAMPFALFLVVPFAILSIAWKDLSWDSFEYGRELRILILAVAFPLLWTHVTYEYNFFLDQAHHFDRALLVALYALIWLHPVFAYPFLVLLMVIMGQFVYPFGGLSTTDRRLPISFLTLFSAFLFLQLRFWSPVQFVLEKVGLADLGQSTEFPSKVFVWAAGGLVGASYFTPAISKLRILWPIREELYYYVPSSYVSGWLGHLDTQTVLQIYSAMQVLNPLGVLATIVIEAGAVFLMWRRKVSVVLIASFVFLHATIFVFSGIAFWKWVIVDIAFLWFILRIDSDESNTLFNKKTVAVTTVLILLGPILYQTTALAWYTNNYDVRYTVEAVSDSDEVHEVHWSEMQPYIYTFASNRFSFIDNGTVIAGAGTDYTLTKKLRQAKSEQDLDRLKERYGTSPYNREKSQRFDCFIEDYFETYQDRRGKEVIWSKIPSLPHFWSNEPTEPLPSEENITAIQIRKSEYLYTENQIKQTETGIIREVNLSSERKPGLSCRG